MSTVFEQSSGFRSQSLDAVRNLELRTNPHIRPIHTHPGRSKYDPVIRPDNDGGISAILLDTVGNFTSNWIYTALIEDVFNGPQPLWSKDSWSFVPLDLSSLPDLEAVERSENEQIRANFSNFSRAANLTFETTAIRATINCTHILEGEDPRNWLSALDPSTMLPTIDSVESDTSFLSRSDIFPGTDYHTTLVSGWSAPRCCVNASPIHDPYQHSSAMALGYWTMNFPRNMDVNQSALYEKTGNFTVKWVLGSAHLYQGSNLTTNGTLYFNARPKMQALNCRPKIESAAAIVTIDHKIARVQSYQILGDIQPENIAWSDSFVLRDHNSTCQMDCMRDVTTR